MSNSILGVSVGDTASLERTISDADIIAFAHATGEIIVTTDADCQPGTEWIQELVKHFDAGVGLVAGYNPYRARTSGTSRFQEMLHPRSRPQYF